MHFSRRKLILFSIVALAGLLVAAELGVRLVCWAVGRVPYTVATPWARADDELLYVFEPNFEGRIFQNEARINALGLRGPDVSARKGAGMKRVLCLGDSRTFGYVVAAEEAYPGVLQRLWREQHPASGVEVLNAGRHGYTSYQGLRYLQTRGIAFQPDVVTVAFDFNDRRFVFLPEQADGPEYFAKAARGLRWRNRLSFSYLLLGFNRVMQHVHRTDTWAQDVLERPPEAQRLDRLACRVEAPAFEANLRAIAAFCKERGIACVFLAMADTPVLGKAFAEARRLREAGRPDEAAAILSRLMASDLKPAMRDYAWPPALYETGLALEAQGRPVEAQAAFREGAHKAAFWSIMGGLLVRHTGPYLEALRRVAETESIPVVSVDRAFADRPELFHDNCHYTAEGHRRIAELLLECLAENRL